jgi:hypothetical protein
MSPKTYTDEPLFDRAEPRADAMIHSLRAFGYDLATALADLIDNSITAGAKNIWLHFHWNGERSTISLFDDGAGMTEQTLLDAMRPGSATPLAERSQDDLGRFGLGLKTASFSQAKRLTVVTKQAGGRAVRCWDLDYVTECQDWRLLRSGSADCDAKIIPTLDKLSSGTAVFWEAMDRLTPLGTDVNNSKAQDQFYQRVDRVKAHQNLGQRSACCRLGPFPEKRESHTNSDRGFASIYPKPRRSDSVCPAASHQDQHGNAQ